MPEQAAIDEAVKSVSYRNIDIEGNTVRLADPGAAVDLGGVAKGYIADRITDLLEEKGVSSAVINLGGNVAVLGSKEDGSPWNIGIERPYSDRTEVIGSLEAIDATVVTSGTYEREIRRKRRIVSSCAGSGNGLSCTDGSRVGHDHCKARQFCVLRRIVDRLPRLPVWKRRRHWCASFRRSIRRWSWKPRSLTKMMIWCRLTG